MTRTKELVILEITPNTMSPIFYCISRGFFCAALKQYVLSDTYCPHFLTDLATSISVNLILFWSHPLGHVS
jgi:hypothetical protein